MAYIGQEPTLYVDGSIETAHIAADQITGAKIADDAIDSEHYTDGSIDTAHIAADQITGAKIADDAIDSEHYTDGSIDTAHLAADAVTGAKIADDAIDSEHYTDGSIDLAHMASQSVDEDNLYISNAGSNGQFLSKQSGNSGGLTWATAGGGKVLQVVWDEGSGGALDTSSTTYVDTTAAANITAASSSNKVLVIVTAPVYKGGQNDTNISWTLGLHRDISGGSSDTLLHEVWMGEGIGANGLSRAMFCTFTYLDSPSTTSQLTYQVVFKTGGTQLSVFPGETITLMEIEV